MRRARTLLWPLLLLLPCGGALAAARDEPGLHFDRQGERQVIRPSAGVFHVEVSGIVSTVTVWQLFENPAEESVDAVYVFPIPEGVAVDRLEMRVGDQTIHGLVKERHVAKKLYERAAAQGQKGSLLERRRSNVFSISVANIPPRGLVEIVVGWDQEVDFRAGVFSLRVPTVVAPRYGEVPIPGSEAPRLLSSLGGLGAGGPLPVGLQVDLVPGFPLAEISSSSHSIVVENEDAGRYSVTLEDEMVRAERDFVLEWRPEPSRAPRVGLVTTTGDDGERHLLLVVIPPSGAEPLVRIPREVVFVIDTSGSMTGASLEQAKAALGAAVEGLEPGDRFNVIQFNEEAEPLFEGPQWAEVGAIASAGARVAELEAGGGTLMQPALALALADDGLHQGVRQVVFITDGQIHDEEGLFAYIRSHLGRSRLFTVGIGSAPNNHFLRNAARHGRGDFTHVGSVEEVGRRIRGLATRLENPALTDLSVVWPDALAEAVPDPIPDLYSGEPLVLSARLAPFEGTIEIRGWRGDELWEESIPVHGPARQSRRDAPGQASVWDGGHELPAGVRAAAVRKLWAARKIETLTDSLMLEGADPGRVRAETLEVALRYGLVTRYTSLVAVESESEVALASAGLSVVAVDPEGFPLAGVAIELVGPGGRLTGVTGSSGEASFPGLAAGEWRLVARSDGFATVELPNVVVGAREGTLVEVSMSTAAQKAIVVTSESPVLDEYRILSGTTVDQIELERIPTSRDPWSVLRGVQGVTVDRINVGGSESGQQSVFTGPGVSDNENTFMLNGVEITDMAAAGASSIYFDFDRFTEMQFGIGGADVTKSAAGISVNLITERGTNQLRGSARFFRTDENILEVFTQSVPLREGAGTNGLAANQDSFVGNSIDKVADYGFEAGGPVVRDRLWVWGSLGVQEIRNRTGGATEADVQPDDTELDNTSFQVNAQLANNNSAVGSWTYGDKKKLGRDAGPTRPRPTAWNQRGSSTIVQIEDTHVFSSNLFLSGSYGQVDSGFELTSIGVVTAGGLTAAPETTRHGSGVWGNSYRSGSSSRRSEELEIDGSYFFSAANTNHELRFGGRRREFETVSPYSWPGRDVLHTDGLVFGIADPVDVLFVHAGQTPLITQNYTSTWVQDTISAGAWTLNAGLRYDLQEGRNEPFERQPNPAFGDILGPLAFPGQDFVFDWSDISPRIGVTYALGEERKTLLRASFSHFPEQLQTADGLRQNPIADTYATFVFIDEDGDDFWDGDCGGAFGDGSDCTGEEIFLDFVSPSANELTVSNRTDTSLDAPVTQEVLFSAEHAFLPELAVGLNVTLRNTDDVKETRLLIEDPKTGMIRTATAGDYVLDRMVTGETPSGPYAEPQYNLFCGAGCRTGGSLLVNGDREQEYEGFGVTFTKRLSNRWMARGYFNYGETEWDVPSSYTANQDPTDFEGGFDNDGGLFAVQAAGFGAKQDVFIQSTWQYNVNGMYQVAPDRPWGFNVAANVFGREGTPLPYFHRVRGSDRITRDVQVTPDVDSVRSEDILTVDLRLEKEFAATGNVAVTVSLDAFNVLDEDSVLQRERRTHSSQYNWLRETLSPRIWRLGVRLVWR